MITIEDLQARFPDAENWEDRGDGLFRGKDASFRYIYVLDLPELRIPRPVKFSVAAIVEPDNYMPEMPFDVRRGGVAAMAAAIDVGQDSEAESFIRAELTRQIEYQNLPTCVVPDCVNKAPVEFGAAEHGRLAGSDWRLGDKIRVCPEHAHDIYRAQGVYGRDQLAEWLRPDAKLDPLDAFDAATDLLFGLEIEHNRARMLRVSVQEKEKT